MEPPGQNAILDEIVLSGPGALVIIGKFNVPASQKIRCPRQRVKPVERQKAKRKGLPPMVLAAQVGFLMGKQYARLLSESPDGK